MNIYRDMPSYNTHVLEKDGTLYRKVKNYNKKASGDQVIVYEDPDYGPSIYVDMQKELERAKAEAGE